jgi:hypothetical protein
MSTDFSEVRAASIIRAMSHRPEDGGKPGEKFENPCAKCFKRHVISKVVLISSSDEKSTKALSVGTPQREASKAIQARQGGQQIESEDRSRSNFRNVVVFETLKKD